MADRERENREHPTPFAIIEMPVNDAKTGSHHHLDMVYVCRATTDLTHEPDEISDCAWAALADLDRYTTPRELPALINEGADHVKATFGVAATPGQ